MQKKVAEFVAQHKLEADVESRMLDLVSEVGELAKEVLKSNAYGQQEFTVTDSWHGELADVLFAVICLANSTGVNLEETLDAALTKYAKRLADKGDAGSGH